MEMSLRGDRVLGQGAWACGALGAGTLAVWYSPNKEVEAGRSFGIAG